MANHRGRALRQLRALGVEVRLPFGQLRVELAPGLPDNYPVACSLVCSDGSDEYWVSTFQLESRNAVMLYVDCTIDDAGSTWPNGRLDPGETVQLSLVLANGGGLDAEGRIRVVIAHHLDGLEASRVQCQQASERLLKAGAHHVIDTVADLLPCLDRIEHALTEGARP